MNVSVDQPLTFAVDQPPATQIGMSLTNSNGNYTSQKFFPPFFLPGNNDVIIGRGKQCIEHSGNKRLRRIVASKLEEYSAAMTKNKKSSIISSIVSQVRSVSPAGNFIKQDPNGGRWFDVGDSLAREKVSQAFRDALHRNYRSSNESKKKRRRELNAKAFANKQLPKRSRTETNSCETYQDTSFQIDRKNHDDDKLHTLLLEHDIVSGMLSSLPNPPDSGVLDELFETDSKLFEPIAMSKFLESDNDLYDLMTMPLDFKKFSEKLDVEGNLQKGGKNHNASLSRSGLTSIESWFCTLPSCNSNTAKSA